MYILERKNLGKCRIVIRTNHHISEYKIIYFELVRRVKAHWREKRMKRDCIEVSDLHIEEGWMVAVVDVAYLRYIIGYSSFHFLIIKRNTVIIFFVKIT